MDDFKNKLDEYGQTLRDDRCPLTVAELDKSIRHATWQAPTATGSEPTVRRRWWPAVAAAACVALVLLPLGIRSRDADGIRTVSVDGEQVFFACNNGCTPEGTVEIFKTLLK